MVELKTRRPRGRPKSEASVSEDTKLALLRAGMAMLTEKGFTVSGIEPILKSVGVPKGSFYHYFSNKEAFGLAVLKAYQQYFESKLDHFLQNEELPYQQRLVHFSKDACEGMVRHHFKRGCLVGNLEQESVLLSESFNQHIQACYQSWQNRLAQYLQAGQVDGVFAFKDDANQMAQIFWLGWEGAVHRARLLKSCQPLESYMAFYLANILKPE
ncbi:acrylate utilization transcriptional regulator AcuR [Marinomonas sp. TW1]|uniref:acrylate utilization transcriptional regulator AcuR n=1 Tax=Marinomonas sp. TW1 TaxID=1561203 RepID=UPI0007AF16E3|nr:TetR/AcrR family transcriptional regulator [Marinomonas sp. TW1]KZN14426.1 TetR family transcriptional regulator [Marinomonas sp. TW1]